MPDSKTWKNRITNGLCGGCGLRPARPNRTHCIQCSESSTKTHIKRYAKQKEEIKNRRLTFIFNGLCSNCGKNQPIQNKKTCQKCVDLRKSQYSNLKDRCFNAYGGYKCVCCGENTKDFLVLDHINNDGATHRKIVKHGGIGKSLYLWIINNDFPSIFQVLCANCNMGKQKNNGICPHKLSESSLQRNL